MSWYPELDDFEFVHVTPTTSTAIDPPHTTGGTMPLTPEQLDERFSYHPPVHPLQVDFYREIRTMGRTMAELIDGLVTEGRYKALAMTAIEEAVMWANKGVATDPGWAEIVAHEKANR